MWLSEALAIAMRSALQALARRARQLPGLWRQVRRVFLLFLSEVALVGTLPLPQLRFARSNARGVLALCRASQQRGRRVCANMGYLVVQPCKCMCRESY